MKLHVKENHINSDPDTFICSQNKNDLNKGGGNGMMAGGGGANSGLLGSAPSRGIGKDIFSYSFETGGLEPVLINTKKYI